jgi:PAS domain S-box-containing protein
MERINVDLKQLRSWFLASLIFWSALVNGSLCLFARNEWKSMTFVGKEMGLAALNKDYIYELWNAKHGGIYAYADLDGQPIADFSAEPSPAKDRRLVLINPARMTREAYQLEEALHDVRGHITSLYTIEPKNRPDSWERQALLQFEQGEKEVAELIKENGKSFMRVMKPAITHESCHKCHIERQYTPGKIRGGISVILPMERIVTIFSDRFKVSALYHFLIYLIGIAAQVVFYVQMSRQLVRRAAVENKLAEQEKYLRSIVDNISNGIAVYQADDGGFLVKSVNSAGRRIAGLTQDEEAAGRAAAEIFPGLSDSCLPAVFQRVAETGQPERLSVSFPAQPGEGAEDNGLQWLEYYVCKLPSGEIVAVYEDVTDKRKAAELLLRKTEEWKSTFDAIPDIITLQDREMRIIQANQAAFDFFHMPPEQLLGSTCHSLFRGAAAPCPGCPGLCSMVDLQKHCSNIEHKLINKFFHVCSAPVLNPAGDFLYFVYIAHDITDKKKLEEELFQAQKMEAIGTLAGGIAHDFNNILAAILGYAELAKMELPPDSNVRSDLDQVIIAGNRATELVKQILTFSRKSEHQKKPLRIYLIVKEAVKMLRSSLPSTIDIRADIDESSGLVLADPTNIHQIVFNLCTNAAHAIGSKQGRLDIILRRTAAAPVHGMPEPRRFAVLTVRDNGSGMDEKTMARIFDPYFTTKEPGAGTGLGLAVTRGVVEDCQGFIEVESEPGKGTAFHIYLPLLPEDSGELPEPDHAAPLPRGKERILFVDDERAIAQISQSILSGLGYKVAAETDSMAAWKKFRQDPAAFDLVIADQTMPGLTGSELAKAMFRLRPDLPVILCTGYTASLSEKDALALGIRRYALKPLNTAKLAALVREVLDEGGQG